MITGTATKLYINDVYFDKYMHTYKYKNIPNLFLNLGLNDDIFIFIA